MSLRSILVSSSAWLALSAPVLAYQDYVETSDEGQSALDEQSNDVAAYNRMHYDENFQLTQASSNGSSDNSQPTTQARTSRVPYMIGDSPSSSTPLSGLAFEGVQI